MQEEFVPLPGFGNLVIPKELMPIVLPASMIYQGLNILGTILSLNSQLDTAIKITKVAPRLLPQPKRMII